MKKQIAVGMLSAALAVTAQATLVTYDSGPVNIGIPDNNAVGVQSTISPVSGASVLDVDVYLNIAGTFNGDLYVTLTHGANKAVLLNRVGVPPALGYVDNGFDVTLSDEAGIDVHMYGGAYSGTGGGPLTGTYQPDGRDVDPSVVNSSDARLAMLDVFDGMSAGGGWTLFLSDAAGGDVHTLVSWKLELDVRDGGQVPDSSLGGVGFSAILFGGLLALARRRSWVHGN